MIKFKTDYGFSIGQVDVLRETEASVFFPPNRFSNGKERREAKESSWYKYHDSWNDAKSHLVKREEEKLQSLKDQAADVERDLQKARDLVEPK